MNQPTYEEHTERCKQKVWPNGQFTSHRCSRKAVKDGYCNQHHPETVKARDEKHRAEYERKRALHPLTLAHKQIEELKQQRDELLEALKAYTNFADSRRLELGELSPEMEVVDAQAQTSIAKVTKS